MNKNKMIALIGTVIILTIGGLMFAQIYKNHQANEQIIATCFAQFGETVEKVTIQKDGFFSTVHCEKK